MRRVDVVVIAILVVLVFVLGFILGSGKNDVQAHEDGVEQQQCADYWCNPEWYNGIVPDPPVGYPHYTNPRNRQQYMAPRPTHNPPGARSGGGQYQNPNQ